MFFTKKDEMLHLTSWSYNAAQIIEELRKIVINEGGRVRPSTSGFIVNRSIDEEIKNKRLFIERCEACAANTDKPELQEKMKKAIENTEARIAELEAINNEPVHLSGAPLYLTFVLGDMIYSYSFDSNPFFEFYYSKAQVKNDQYSLDIPMTEDKKEWLYDCFFYCNCSWEDIREAANIIFNVLMSARVERPLLDRHKRRVPNMYNSGYHYEWITEKERFQRIDF